MSIRSRSIFLAAIEKGPDERPAFLDGACGDDRELRARVEHLLEAHQALGSIHFHPIPGPAANAGERFSEGPGSVIGPYKLLEAIGEGGMGTVYMAEQERPVRRRVALKIIKPGMDSAQVIARFEAERQALALMDHPHIAKVLEAGDDGVRPAVLRHGTGQGRPHHPSSATSIGSRSASAWSCSCRSARRCSTRTRRGSSTATSSPPTSSSPSTTASRCPR